MARSIASRRRSSCRKRRDGGATACRGSWRRLASLGKLTDLISSREAWNGAGSDLREGFGGCPRHHRGFPACPDRSRSGRPERRSSAGASHMTLLGSKTNLPPDLLDGTLSGLGDEEEDDSPKSSWLRFPSPSQPWLDFKQKSAAQAARPPDRRLGGHSGAGLFRQPDQ